MEQPLHLPGDVIILPRKLMEQANGPEAAAGAALVERLRMKAEDPIVPLLQYAGLRATFELLTTASLPDTALSGYGEAMLRATPLALPDAALLAAFEIRADPGHPLCAGCRSRGQGDGGPRHERPVQGPRPLATDPGRVLGRAARHLRRLRPQGRITLASGKPLARSTSRAFAAAAASGKGPAKTVVRVVSAPSTRPRIAG